MNCRRARNLLFDFFDGVSNEALRAEVDRHLGECAECERFAAEMARSLALLRRAPVEPLDENFNWKVRLAIHREKNTALARARSAGAWVRMWNVRYAVSGGLAFSAVLVAGMLLVRQGNIPVPGPATQDPVLELSGQAGPVPTPPERPAQPARRTTTTGADAGHLVSTGPSLPNRAANPIAGAIDMTEAEARIDSLIRSDVMRMPTERERAEYIQRLDDLLQQHRQRQQPAPAQR